MKRAIPQTLAAAALALLLAACSSEAPKLEAAGVGASVGAGSTAAVTQALSPEEVAQSAPSAVFNPFGDPVASNVGGREVLANPTKADVLAQAGSLPEISLGNPDAPVTLVQYASLTCPYCKRFHEQVFPVLKREYIDTGKVRYILREFPIGRTSGQATVALRCAQTSKVFDLYGHFLADQPSWVSMEVRLDQIAAVAAKGGVTRAAYDACRAEPALTEALKQIKDRGRKLGVIGTPNFFLDDKLIKKALTQEELRAALDGALGARTASAAVPTPQQ